MMSRQESERRRIAHEQWKYKEWQREMKRRQKRRLDLLEEDKKQQEVPWGRR